MAERTKQEERRQQDAPSTDEASAEKLCFVICPISDKGTPTHKRSDQVLRHIIEPAAKECGYKAFRADEITAPGIITNQVIDHLINDPLVIADLTDHNANVFYELAVRHAVGKPLVQIIDSQQHIPFDVSQMRTIKFDVHDLDSVANCRKEIVEHIETVEKDPALVDNPISNPISLALYGKELRDSGNPLGLVLERLQAIESQITSMQIAPRYMLTNDSFRSTPLPLSEQTRKLIAALDPWEETMRSLINSRNPAGWPPPSTSGESSSST